MNSNGCLVLCSVILHAASLLAAGAAAGVTSIPDSGVTGAFALESMHDNFTCVHGCSCQLVDYTRSRYAVLCQGPSIRAIPAFLTEDLHQIESMTLLRTSITKIGLVTTFPAVESLHIAGSRLAQLSDFNLMQHPALRDVDFSANQLDSFVSKGSMSLRTLKLSGNLFTRLDSVGASYVALRLLNVAQNRLTLNGLIDWDPPPELEVLDLSGNLLGVESGTLRRSSNASFLGRLRQLQQLDLSDNRLISLKAITDWLPADARLWKLSLSKNPFVCSCSLYRDKQRLAWQGVVIADTPTCRLSNGSDCPLTRLGSWACDGDNGGGSSVTKTGPTLAPREDLASASLLLRLPAVLGLTAAAAAALAILAVGGGVWACRRRRHQQRRQKQRQQQELDSECPYNTVSAYSYIDMGGNSVSNSSASIDASNTMNYMYDEVQQRPTTARGGDVRDGAVPIEGYVDMCSNHSANIRRSGGGTILQQQTLSSIFPQRQSGRHVHIQRSNYAGHWNLQTGVQLANQIRRNAALLVAKQQEAAPGSGELEAVHRPGALGLLQADQGDAFGSLTPQKVEQRLAGRHFGEAEPATRRRLTQPIPELRPLAIDLVATADAPTVQSRQRSSLSPLAVEHCIRRFFRKINNRLTFQSGSTRGHGAQPQFGNLSMQSNLQLLSQAPVCCQSQHPGHVIAQSAVRICQQLIGHENRYG
uniref:LRRCT domain-containing protein n=1 Tax=Macrostomum lignano TaxID=282301 RepID=A0A1I8IN52_9PLAT